MEFNKLMQIQEIELKATGCLIFNLHTKMHVFKTNNRIILGNSSGLKQYLLNKYFGDVL